MYGLNPSDRHKDGFTPIHRACWGFTENHTKTVQALLNVGVSPLEPADAGDAPVSGKVPLSMTSNPGTKEVLEKAIAELNANKDL